MDLIWILVIGTIIIALIFDVINGFHDAANSIATVVSTRVLPPKIAILWAAFFNFVAIFFFAPRVANTVSKIVKIDASDPTFVWVVLSGLVGAIIWDLFTWWFGLPTSSSHALIGGFVGSGITYAGMDIIHWEMVTPIFAYIPIAPLIGFALGLATMLIVYWIFRKAAPARVDKIFRKGQLVSAALYSIGHGGNDAQKTMGIIVAVLVAAGALDQSVQLSLTDWHTMWIILSCNMAMAIGTAIGGWRIVKTMGMKITKLQPVHGFCAELSGAATLFFATHLGIPVSTTHTIVGSIVGVGTTRKFSTIRWGIAARIVYAWVLTIPASAIIASGFFYATKVFH
jgi:inorganic phosphate transporter, PiT family